MQETYLQHANAPFIWQIEFIYYDADEVQENDAVARIEVEVILAETTSSVYAGCEMRQLSQLAS